MPRFLIYSLLEQCRIGVIFDLDANGAMNVFTKEKSTSFNKDSQITVTNDKDSLSHEKIERMVEEVEKYAAEDDAMMKEKIEAKNGM